MINWQLTNRVSTDQCHMTVSQVQVYNSLRVFSFPLTSYLFSSDRRLRKLYFRKPLNENEADEEIES